MKKHSKFVAAVTAASLGMLALAGCSGQSGAPAESESASASKGEIAFFAASSQIEIVKTLSENITDYFEAEGYTVSIRDAGFDPVKQAQQIQQALDTKSIVGAWIFPVAAETLSESVSALQAAGIPAVLEGAPAGFGFSGEQAGLAFNSPDFVKYGEKIGELAGTCASEKSGTEAMFLTPPGTSGGTAEVVDAIKSAYEAGASGAPIVATSEAGDLAEAQTAVAQLLIANPDADVVIATTDETALGAVAAYKAADKTPLCVVAGGGAPDTLAAQAAGEVTAVVAWDYSASVDTLGPELVRLMASPDSDGKIVDTSLTVTE